MRKLSIVAMVGILMAVAGCSGNGGTSVAGGNTITGSAANVQPVTVSPGPTYVSGNPNTAYLNGVFTSVTVCVPGTSNCQTIDNVLVDTGSVGLRLVSSSAGGELTLPLPQQTDVTANAVTECDELEDGYTYGPIRTADIKLSGEQAPSAAVQVIGDPAFSSVPASCGNTGLAAENTLQSLGANGLLGVGPFLQDCGLGCVSGVTNNPSIYYSCSGSGCQDSVISLAQQVQNPVSLFSVDNNGVILELPAISASGANNVSGALVFGIGTQSNNGLGNSAVFPADNNGNILTSFSNNVYTSFLDSGSNALFFLTQSLTNIPVCSDDTDFYCPASTMTVPVINEGASGVPTQNVNLSVANADSLSSNFTAFNNIAGPWGPPPEFFDFGLSFFFGRNVYTAFEASNTPAGVGPFFAY